MNVSKDDFVSYAWPHFVERHKYRECDRHYAVELAGETYDMWRKNELIETAWRVDLVNFVLHEAKRNRKLKRNLPAWF